MGALNPTPHAITVRFVATVARGRATLTTKRPHLHRLDRASLRLAHSIDHLVGAQEDRLWNGETECLGGLQIDADVETPRLLERQVRRFRPLQKAINEIGRTVVNFIHVWAEGR